MGVDRYEGKEEGGDNILNKVTGKAVETIKKHPVATIGGIAGILVGGWALKKFLSRKNEKKS